MMIRAIVQSAFQTRCLSVESEGLIRQLLSLKSCQAKDLIALEALFDAVQNGHIEREAHKQAKMPLIKAS